MPSRDGPRFFSGGGGGAAPTNPNRCAGRKGSRPNSPGCAD